ncbi:MAG TPA: hypothetical protein VD866_15380 [Urbifossiella sp.]|nr:hypothetical protein [Urbifossiella sp.]
MDDVYRYSKRLIYTEGVRHLAQTAGAVWLITLIDSHQGNPKARAEEFQVWRLVVNVADNTGVVTMTDGNNDTAIITQRIPYTDYAKAGEDQCELYLVQTPGQPSVLMLPCEY